MPAIPTNRGAIWVAHKRARGQPVLVMVHGAGGNRLVWPASLRRLPDVETLLLDLPGHDRSPGPARDTIDAYADDVLAVLDALQIEGAYVLGHSMGGAVALTLALAHPERVHGLVLLATGAKLAVAPALLEADDAAVSGLLVDWSWGPQADAACKERHRVALHDLPSGTLHADLTACNRFDVRDRLGAVDMPALVISGAHDRMTPPRYSDFLETHLPDALRVTLDGGHMLMLEQPEETAAAVRNWLQNQNTA